MTDGPHGWLGLDGRLALVTGGAGGIGRAVCSSLRDAGARVIALDRAGRTPDPGVESVECDLGAADAMPTLAAALGADTDRVDVLVHCAGITRDRVLWKLTDDDWRQVMSVNLDAAFRVLRLLVPGMRARGDGRIVLVASINGERGKFGQSNYAASKAGLIALAKSAAKELGRAGIRVNVVSPGMIDTEMTADLPAAVRQVALDESALGRTGRPEDVAHAVLFLCSELSAHVTGQVLRVDGGQCTA